MRQFQSVILVFFVFAGFMAALVLQEFLPHSARFETTITLDFPKSDLNHDFSYRDFYLEQAAIINHAQALESDQIIDALIKNEKLQKIIALEKSIGNFNEKPDTKQRLFNAISAVASDDTKQIVVTVTDFNSVLAREIATLIPNLYNDMLAKQMIERLVTQKIKGEILNLIHDDEDKTAVDPVQKNAAADMVLDQIADIDASLTALSPVLPQTLGDPKLTSLFARYVQIKLDLSRENLDTATKQHLFTEMGKIKADFHTLLINLRVALGDKFKSLNDGSTVLPSALTHNPALTEIVALDQNDQKRLTEKPFVSASAVKAKYHFNNNTLLLVGVGALSGLVLGMTALFIAQQIARYRLYRKRLHALLKQGANDNKRKAA